MIRSPLVALVVAIVMGHSASAAGPVTLIRTTAMGLRDDSVMPINPATRKLDFRSSTKADPLVNGVVPPVPGSDGDPTVNGATLVVYDSAGSGERTPEMTLPASQWVRRGTDDRPSYRFRSKDPNQPVARITLGRDRLAIRAVGAAFAYTLNEPSQGSIAIRLTLGPDVLTFCAEGGGALPPGVDVQDRFTAVRNTPPPATCPAVP